MEKRILHSAKYSCIKQKLTASRRLPLLLYTGFTCDGFFFPSWLYIKQKHQTYLLLKISSMCNFTLKDFLSTVFARNVARWATNRGHDSAQIQEVVGLRQEVLHEAHGESLQHQSPCTEVVNGLISPHYSDLLGTWVSFRALRAGMWGFFHFLKDRKWKKKVLKNNYFILKKKWWWWWGGGIVLNEISMKPKELYEGKK